MQVEFNKLNAAKKEITLTIEADKVQKDYRSYLRKSSGEVSIPGFRKGKAPLDMVERSYGDKIKDYFYKDYVDEVFTQAAQEYDINYLLYPEIKDVQWSSGEPMVIKIDIEVEPEVVFNQIEGLTVPYKPLDLQAEKAQYIEELRKENSTIIDVDAEIVPEDEIELEAKCHLDGNEFVHNYVTHVNEHQEAEITPAALGKKIGDTFSITLPHHKIHDLFPDAQHANHDIEVEVFFMVNAIRRRQLPDIDNEFAKDLEFENLEDMYEKIEAELSAKNELKNLNIKINSLITKLYIDNRFDLPENTLKYVAEKEMEQYNITDPQWKKYYEFQIRYQITQDFMHMYLMQALRKEYAIELSVQDYQNYYEHNASLADQSVEDWKTAHSKEIEADGFKETVENFTILKKIADTSNFVIQEDEQVHPEEAIVPEVTDAETV